MSELRRLAHYSSDLHVGDVPENVRTAAKYCILDSMGAAIGAAWYEEIPEIVRQVLAFSGADGANYASVWGHNRNTSIFQAVLLNGIMGHALELDDVHTNSKTHIGAVVVPAAWSLAQSTETSGLALLESVIAGYEIMARIGKGFGVASHRQKGWHVTGTAGTFGAAAACSKLLRLNPEQTLNAFGMAGTQSSGLWAFLEDGASSKKLHPARAAVNGLVGALLAKAGMTGPEHILDAKDGGLYRATSDFYNLDDITAGLGTKYELLETDKKPYPCCRSTHCAIDAILSICKRCPLTPERIASILVRTYEIGVRQCGSPQFPRTPNEAKFSTPFTVASALKHSQITLQQFLGKNIDDQELKELSAKVKVIEDKKYTDRYPDHWGCCVEVTCTDGTLISEEVTDASGSVYKPLSDTQARKKFTDLAEPVLGVEKADSLLDTILAIEDIQLLPAI